MRNWGVRMHDGSPSARQRCGGPVRVTARCPSVAAGWNGRSPRICRKTGGAQKTNYLASSAYQATPPNQSLFDLHGRARFRELLLDGLGLFLVHAFFDGLRRTVHEILGFLQTEAGNFPYRLNNIDLVSPNASQHDGEFRLFLNRG